MFKLRSIDWTSKLLSTLNIYESEDTAELLRHFVVPNDLRVVLHVLVPSFPAVFLYLDLEEVLADFVPSEVREGWVLDQNAGCEVVLYFI
jgi:hypothetical protein